MSTRGTRGGGNVVSPNNNNADAQSGDAPNNVAGAGDDNELNEELGLVDNNAAEDANEAAAEDVGLMRERAAAAASARSQMGMGANLAVEGDDLDSVDENEDGDTNRNLFDNNALPFEHICPITQEAPLEPVFWGSSHQVFERQAVLDFVASTEAEFINHPITRIIYLPADFPNILTPVPDDDHRRPLILAERQRLGLEM